MLLTSIAMLIALALVELSLPWLSSFLNTDLRLDYLGEGGVIGPLIVLLLVVGLAGGLYPAFYLSRFQPATVLRRTRPLPIPRGAGGSGTSWWLPSSPSRAAFSSARRADGNRVVSGKRVPVPLDHG